MAVRFAAATDGLSRTSNVPSYDANYSFILLFYFGTRPGSGAYGNLVTISDGTNDADYYSVYGNSASDTRIRSGTQSNGTFGAETTTTTNLSPATWYVLGVRRTANNSRQINIGTMSSLLATEGTNTVNVNGRTAASRLDLGAYYNNNDPFSGRIKAFRFWSIARTLAELQACQFGLRPVFYNSLNTWCPIFTGSGERGRDYSGNGYNLAEDGALTDEDDPPISY